MKNDIKAKVEILRKLNLYEPTSIETANSVKIDLLKSNKRHNYFKYQNQDFHLDHFYHYPIIVDTDGSLWREANRYLLSRLGGFNPAKHRTLETIASDLLHFRKWLVEEEIDFLNITTRPRARPTYRYASYLFQELQLGNGKPSTAKRRISSMQNFYRWLEKDGYKFNYPLWIENDLKIGFHDRQGFQQSKSIKSTDLTKIFKTPKVKDEYSEYIDDGGKLRPLSQEEQIAIVEALKEIGNIEMLLSFFLALTTGARLQTTFTFRQKQFNEEVSDNITHHRVKVGGHTLIDTKNNTQMVLHIPSWLYQHIQIYLRSERYLTRVSSSKHVYKNVDEQYSFLTRNGQPYYMAKEDDFAFLYRSPPRGNSVTQFIRQQLKPKLKDKKHEFSFRFHDLRATFGMNLLEEKLGDYPQSEQKTNTNQPGFFQLLMYVKTRMGHSRIRTTEAYLNYRENYKLALHVQTEFEDYLMQLIDTKGSKS